jgi:hypothetical protein
MPRERTLEQHFRSISWLNDRKETLTHHFPQPVVSVGEDGTSFALNQLVG